MRRWARMAGASLAASACTGAAVEPPGCLDDGDCAGLAVCNRDLPDAEAPTRGTCEPVECLESAQCPLETYCDVDQHACTPGCQSPEDCYVGDVCDETGTCVVAACTDSQIDCAVGEVCDTGTGDCADVPDLCASCSGDGWTWCRDTLGGDCRWFTDRYYCLPPCSEDTPAAELPRAFDCYDLSANGSGRFRLFGDCEAVAERRAE